VCDDVSKGPLLGLHQRQQLLHIVPCRTPAAAQSEVLVVRIDWGERELRCCVDTYRRQHPSWPQKLKAKLQRCIAANQL
jgi:hypothetical protein